jgi:hypothetical protein
MCVTLHHLLVQYSAFNGRLSRTRVEYTKKEVLCQGVKGDVLTTGIVSHKFLFFVCHSGLDPESSLSELDSRFRGNDDFGVNVKRC